jgi:diacylglycerol kinase (ATP)
MTRAMCPIPDDANRVLIMVNPTAGAGSKRAVADELGHLLRADGWVVEWLSDPSQLDTLERDPRGTRVRAVVAAGGDGTVSTVINRTHRDTPIAILPLGTENLLAKYLDLSESNSAAPLSRAITAGTTVRLDAGRAGNRIFMLMVGCGFDAEVVRRLHARRRGHIRHWSYVKPLLDAIRSYQYPELRLYCGPARATAAPAETGGPEESPITLSARWVFVVNVPKYAGGLRFAPEASGTDGLLDVCTFQRGSLPAGLRYLTGVILGRHLQWSDCTYLRTRQLRIESDDVVHYQLDGDYGGELPLEIRVLPERVRLVVSQPWAIAHGFRRDTETKA